MDLPEILTVPEAAALLRLHPRRAYLLCQQGIIPCRYMGRSIRIRRDTLLKWMEGQNIPEQQEGLA